MLFVTGYGDFFLLLSILRSRWKILMKVMNFWIFGVGLTYSSARLNGNKRFSLSHFLQTPRSPQPWLLLHNFSNKKYILEDCAYILLL